MSNLFRNEAMETQRERLWGDVILIQPISFTLLTAAACLIVVLVGLFLTFGTFAKKENVAGYLEPDLGLVKVYAETPGIVIEAHKQDGDFVAKDAPLFTISTQRITTQSGDVDAKIVAELERSKITVNDQINQQRRLNQIEETGLRDRIDGLSSEIEQLRSTIAVRERQQRVAKERLDSVANLLAKHYVSQDQYKEVQERFLQTELLSEEAKGQLITKQNERTAARNQLFQLPMKASMSLASLQQSLTDINQRLEESRARRVYVIRAPLSGRVTAQQLHTGQMVKTNVPLLAIVPQNSTLRAQLFVPTRAVGFVHPGQHVLLQYSAFPYQKFGLYPGTIAQVAETILSPDEIPVPVPLQEPVYRVTVTPEKQNVQAYGRDIPLQPGMLLSADIILERRNLSQWLLEPLYSLAGRL